MVFTSRYLFIAIATAGAMSIQFADSTECTANQTQATYSMEVKMATAQHGNQFAHAVYVWPWVKSPGAYEFKKGMTVADLISKAGGLVTDDRYPKQQIKGTYDIPRSISVKRPSHEQPDPTASIFKFKLDWSKADRGMSSCKFELHEGDLVQVSMSEVVP